MIRKLICVLETHPYIPSPHIAICITNSNLVGSYGLFKAIKSDRYIFRTLDHNKYLTYTLDFKDD